MGAKAFFLAICISLGLLGCSYIQTKPNPQEDLHFILEQTEGTRIWWTVEGYPIVSSLNHKLVLELCNTNNPKVMGCAVWYTYGVMGPDGELTESKVPEIPHQCFISIWIDPKDTVNTPDVILTHEKKHCTNGDFHA